jgi:hypothetical protein
MSGFRRGDAGVRVIAAEFTDAVERRLAARNPMADEPASDHRPRSAYSAQAVEIDWEIAFDGPVNDVERGVTQAWKI